MQGSNASWPVGGATRQSGGNWVGRFEKPEDWSIWASMYSSNLELGQLITVGDSILKWTAAGVKFVDAAFATQADLDSFCSKIGTPIAADSTAMVNGTQYTYGAAGWVVAPYYDQFGVTRPAQKLPQITTFKDATLTAKFTAIQNALGVMTICCIGESTTKGIGSNGSYVSTDNPASGSWPRHLLNTIRHVTGMHVSEVSCPPAAGGSEYDSRWVPSAGFSSVILGNALFGAFESSTSGETLTFSDPEIGEWDTAIVWVLQSPGYSTGAGTISATGGSPVAISSNNESRRYCSYECKASGLSRDNRITITTTSSGGTGKVAVSAIELYNSKRGSRIRVANFGMGGTTTANWTGDSGTGVRGWWQATALSPDLLLVCLGGNESTSSVPAATHLSRMQSLVTGIGLSAAKIGLLSITPRANESTRSLVDQYVAGYASLTGSNILNYAPATWSAWRNYLPPSMGGSVHLGSPGYKWIADIIADQLLH